MQTKEKKIKAIYEILLVHASSITMNDWDHWSRDIALIWVVFIPSPSGD